MTLGQIQETLTAECLTEKPPLSQQVMVGCASDLMSDVLAFSQTEAVLLTGLTSPQSVRTAEIADIIAVIFVFGKEPPAETIELAKDTGIPLFVSPFTLYVASGKLYESGLAGCRATS